MQLENERRFRDIRALRNAVTGFNTFAIEHGIDTLPASQSFLDYDSTAVDDALADTDAHQARALSGDEYIQYADLHDWVREHF